MSFYTPPSVQISLSRKLISERSVGTRRARQSMNGAIRLAGWSSTVGKYRILQRGRPQRPDSGDRGHPSAAVRYRPLPSAAVRCRPPTILIRIVRYLLTIRTYIKIGPFWRIPAFRRLGRKTAMRMRTANCDLNFFDFVLCAK